MSAMKKDQSDTGNSLWIAGVEYQSRLLVGTGKYLRPIGRKHETIRLALSVD